METRRPSESPFQSRAGPGGRARRSKTGPLVVDFPETGASLRLAAIVGRDRAAAVPARPRSARLHATGETVILEDLTEDDQRTAGGRQARSLDEIWPHRRRRIVGRAPGHRRRRPARRSSRCGWTPCTWRRSARPTGWARSSAGGSACSRTSSTSPSAQRAADPVRWLLADEVGLGKTVEACLILNHLLRTGRAERTLVVAPETLTVQWLGELWRKYHQVFVLLDDKRLADVERDYGQGFNPFEAHRRVVVGLEILRDTPAPDRAGRRGRDRPADRRRGASPAPPAGPPRQSGLPRDPADRRTGPPRPAADRHAAGRGRARVLPAAPAAAARGVPRGSRFRRHG